jgi:CRP/FNR family transcriptional regulator, cyclic AMP receptor protein
VSAVSNSIFTTGRARENVLLADPDLAAVVPEPQRESAIRASLAGVLFVPVGTWDAKADAHRIAGGYGILVLDGLLMRRVGFANRLGGELLGRADLLRPQEHDGEEATLPFEATWRVLSPLRLALLDRTWTHRMAAYPDIGVELTARAVRRARRLATMFTIALHPKLDRRLHLLLWELADRYGRVHTDGVHIDLPLTHELISQLGGAQRPSVSTAIARLGERGLVDRTQTGWLLRGDPPTLAPPDEHGGVAA